MDGMGNLFELGIHELPLSACEVECISKFSLTTILLGFMDRFAEIADFWLSCNV
jgi:hypothetical protein